jgi:hypothetical protein
MGVAMVVGAWSLASAMFGLLLGRLFGCFAKRRRAEEELFTWLDDMRALTALKGCWNPMDLRPDLRARVGIKVIAAAAPAAPQGEIVWIATGVGRMIQ